MKIYWQSVGIKFGFAECVVAKRYMDVIGFQNHHIRVINKILTTILNASTLRPKT